MHVPLLQTRTSEGRQTLSGVLSFYSHLLGEQDWRGRQTSPAFLLQYKLDFKICYSFKHQFPPGLRLQAPVFLLYNLFYHIFI